MARSKFETAYTVESERWTLVDQRGRPRLVFMATHAGIELKVDGHRFVMLVEESRYHGGELRFISADGRRPPQRLLR